MNAVVQPSSISDAPRIIVIGDVHGDVERLVKTVKSLGLFSNTLDWIAEPKNTIVIQLGDQIDSLSRNNESSKEKEQWENLPDVEVLALMDRLDWIAQTASGGTGRVLSLLGNHEIMNTLGLFDYVSLNSMNKLGGPNNRAVLFSPGNQFAQILSRRNIVTRIGPFLFCHGGLLPQHLDFVQGDFNKINVAMQKYLRGNEVLTPDEQYIVRDIIFHNTDGIVWLRKYVELLQNQPNILEIMVDSVCKKTETLVLFVGHNTMNEITRVANGKLYFTDAGFSRAYSLHDNYVEVIEILKNTEQYNIETLRVFI
jgi:hypothetical protein